MIGKLPTSGEERGMTGIGVLILFIALVLVAAIAAGLILDTAGFLQNTAQDTGEQSTSEVSDRLTVLSASGAVEVSDDLESMYQDEGELTLDYSADFEVAEDQDVIEVSMSDVEVDAADDDAEFTVTLEYSDGTVIADDTVGVDDGEVIDNYELAIDHEVPEDDMYTLSIDSTGADVINTLDVSDLEVLGADGMANFVTELGLTVYRSPGAGSIDLQHATIEMFGPSGTGFLIHEDEFADLTQEELEEDFSSNLGTFSVEAVKDSDGSIPVLNSRDDRASINVGLFANPNGAVTDAEAESMQYLEEGDSATLRITTPSGATTTEIVNVPESLAGYAGSTVLL